MFFFFFLFFPNKCENEILFFSSFLFYFVTAEVFLYLMSFEMSLLPLLITISLLLKELIFYFYLPSLQLVLCSMAAVKRLPVHQP